MKNKKYTVKIPKNVILCYCNKKKILTLIGLNKERSLKLSYGLILSKVGNFILIDTISFSKISSNNKKKLRATQKTTLAVIKQLLIELFITLYQKLKFIGVGYRVFNVDNYENKLLMFKLGFSHLIYFKIPPKLNFFCIKSNNLFIYGNFYQEVKKISALIKSYKYPDPYKGKGIIYDNEKIALKEGKKV